MKDRWKNKLSCSSFSPVISASSTPAVKSQKHVCLRSCWWKNNLLAVQCVPDEGGQQAPKKQDSDHQREELLQELSPHTSLLLLTSLVSPPSPFVSLSVSFTTFPSLSVVCQTGYDFRYPPSSSVYSN